MICQLSFDMLTCEHTKNDQKDKEVHLMTVQFNNNSTLATSLLALLL